MTYWLGTGENARKWRQFLMLNHLDSQSALGDQADIGTLQTILKRFEMDVDGLESPAFVDVRNGLRRQIKFLSQRWVDDVKSEIENANNQLNDLAEETTLQIVDHALAGLPYQSERCRR